MRFRLGLSIFVCTLVLSISIFPAFAAVPEPFYGAGYIKGNDSTLGDVIVYVPVDSKDSWGTSDSGYLFNVSSHTYSAIMYDDHGRQYTVSSSSFAFPRYRLSSSSSYNYTDLHLKVSDTNMAVATANPPRLTITESLPIITVGFLGVILFCMMRYKR